MNIQVNSHGVRISVWMSAPSDHLHGMDGYPYGYPCGCPCRIIRTTDSSTRVACTQSFKRTVREDIVHCTNIRLLNSAVYSFGTVMKVAFMKFPKKRKKTKGTNYKLIYLNSNMYEHTSGAISYHGKCVDGSGKGLIVFITRYVTSG